MSKNPVASADSQQILLSGPGSVAFDEVIQTLEELSALQLTVGETLMIGSRGQTNYSYVITALQIGLVLLTGISLYRYRF